MGKEKEESYYKVLGTTARIGNARIKEKYIQAVKKHPPETDPEGFEKVRRAYETLKDPEKRRQYDLKRKYGNSVDDLMHKAFSAIEEEDYEKATTLVKKAALIEPDNKNVLLGLMVLSIENENFEELENCFTKVINMESDPQEITAMFSVIGKLLFDQDYDELALETFEKGRNLYPEQAPIFAIPLGIIYMEMGRLDEAMEQINSAIPSQGEETFDDIHLFVTWSNLILEAGKGLISKVESRFRKLLRSLEDEEKELAYDILLESYEEHYDAADFHKAAFFMNLLKIVADKDSFSEIKEMENEVKGLARIQKEIDRLRDDENAFPLLFIHAFEWFYEEHFPMEQLAEVLDSIPQFMIDTLKENKEEYAAGIMRLKKKYPLLYKHFKEEWDGLFNELTKGFNREMRRELGRIR